MLECDGQACEVVGGSGEGEGGVMAAENVGY